MTACLALTSDDVAGISFLAFVLILVVVVALATRT